MAGKCRLTISAFFLLLCSLVSLYGQDVGKDLRLTVARVIYEGGGDWYSNPSSLPNLLEKIRRSTGLPVEKEEIQLSLKSPELFNYPYLYINGHGNISFDEQEVVRLRTFLDQGGFLHADDNYGMDESFRREMKKVYPDAEFVELPFEFPIYHSVFEFPEGLPKVHEHDGGPPRGLGLFSKGRLVGFYSLNTDLGDGWEDQPVHDDPDQVRIQALRMGVNIFVYAIGMI
ncbi:MAG: DUF4159 domain-containing protein [Chloroflexi bacterium]|nr:DUF4159 domain-containing protein [Chloroflexota bacterium]